MKGTRYKAQACPNVALRKLGHKPVPLKAGEDSSFKIQDSRYNVQGQIWCLLGDMSVALTVTTYPPQKCSDRFSIPILEAAALHYHGVICFWLQNIMKCKPVVGIRPAHDLSKAQVVENERIVPPLRDIKTLRECF